MFTFEYAKDSQYFSLNEKFFDSFDNNYSKGNLRKQFIDNGIIGVDLGSLEEKILLEEFDTLCSSVGTGVVRDAIRRTKKNDSPT